MAAVHGVQRMSSQSGAVGSSQSLASRHGLLVVVPLSLVVVSAEVPAVVVPSAAPMHEGLVSREVPSPHGE
jgi:hypothetical protein